MDSPLLIDLNWDDLSQVTDLIDRTRSVTESTPPPPPRRRGPGRLQWHTCCVCRRRFGARRFAAFCGARCRQVYCRQRKTAGEVDRG